MRRADHLACWRVGALRRKANAHPRAKAAAEAVIIHQRAALAAAIRPSTMSDIAQPRAVAAVPADPSNSENSSPGRGNSARQFVKT